jgi:hypothetical protein
MNAPGPLSSKKTSWWGGGLKTSVVGCGRAVAIRKGEKMESKKSNNKPTDEIRLGRLRATFWPNESPNGVTHNVTFSRLYKGKDGWADSQSYRRDDLLLLGKLANLAHSWFFREEEDREEEALRSEEE